MPVTARRGSGKDRECLGGHPPPVRGERWNRSAARSEARELAAGRPAAVVHAERGQHFGLGRLPGAVELLGHADHGGPGPLVSGVTDMPR